MIFVALVTALAMGAAIEVGWVPLRRRGARRPLLAFVALAIGLVPVVAAAARLLVASIGLTAALAFLPVIVLAILVEPLARLARLPAVADDPDSRVLAEVARAQSLLDVGDVDGAIDLLDRQRARPTGATARLVDLWRTFATEERRRRDGVRISSATTRQAIVEEYAALERRRGRPSLPIVALVLLAGVAVATATPAVLGESITTNGDPCATAIAILDRAGPPSSTTTPNTSLSHLVLVDPGVPATLVDDGGMGLERAGFSRHDPEARPKLVAAGFVGAYRRDWQTLEGRTLSAEIFEFASSVGAMQFHRQMTEYACRFSDQAFETPFPASVGLRVRHSGGDPIVEQIAWVDGSRRLVVTQSFAQPPSDHAAVVEFAGRALQRLQNPT
ncbi:MAG: hypothetical protein Q8M74_06040 [Chloroflexota bacterium]|nr:hypothetical protein [Chloroflexota bacterium]